MLGPLLAFLVIGVLAVVMRALFSPPKPAPYLMARRVEDYGLLCAAAIVADAATAAVIRGRLNQAGIRATLATGTDGRVRVLVFEKELDRARRVVG